MARFEAPTYPTPLRRLGELSHDHVEIWLKHDGLTHPTYGGNKVRKLAALAESPAARRAQRWLTFGASGSHHVLTTALFARARGVACAAVLTAQPHTEHAVDTLRAALGAGLEAFGAGTRLGLPRALLRAYRPGDLVIPPGGSSVLGAAAYADAVLELKAQFAEAGSPAPDWIVMPLGTGGTAAGIGAGTALHGLDARVLAVRVLENPFARTIVERVASAIVSERGGDPTRLKRPWLEIDDGYVGAGYGAPTPEGERAAAVAAGLGLELEPTYTAKAFARVLDLSERLREVGRSRPLRVVYWHTHTARSLEPLLVDAPARSELPRELMRLFR